MTSALLLALLGCATDPLLDPAFIPATEDAVRAEVRFAKASYRVGEAIPVELIVTSNVEKGRTPVDTTMPGPRGRPTVDVWTARPAGAVDPGVWWQDTAGVLAPRASSVMIGTPLTVPLHLNDWIRFDRPGTYALQLHSTRVGGYDISTPAVKLELVARDPAVDAARTAELVAAVDAGGPGADAALRELAWIGSPETLALAVGRLGATPVDPHADGWRTVIALHPDPAGATTALDAAWGEPEVGISAAMVEARVAADYAASFTSPLGAMPAPQEELRHRGFMAEKQPRDAHRAEVRTAALARAAAGVSSKQPAARAVTLGTLLTDLFAAAEPPAWRDPVLALARTELQSLDPAVLGLALGTSWDAVRDPTAAQALAEIVRDPGMPVATRESALHRLASLDPAVARPVILELVEDPARGVSWGALPMLRSLGEIPEPSQQRLVADISTAADRELQMALVATYAGPQLADAVLAEWAAGQATDGTAPTTAILAGYAAYFLKHRPAKAEAALSRWNGEHYELLAMTGLLLPEPSVLVPRAMNALRSAPDEPVYLKASDYLREHASPELLPELIAMVPRTEGRRQEAVIGAIIASRAWLITRDQRLALEPVTTAHRASAVLRLAVCADEANPQLPLQIVDGEPTITLNFHEYRGEDVIRAKLAQFLPGTTLYPRYTAVPADEGLALIRELAPEGVTVYEGKKG